MILMRHWMTLKSTCNALFTGYSHSLIWFLEDDERLSDTVKDIFSDNNADIYLSIVSLWEMAIKIGLGKLKLSQSLEQVIDTLE